jgi:hypothetical protein
MPRDIIEETNKLLKYQLNKKYGLEKKEKDNPEWPTNKERWETYRRLDDRLKEDEKKRNTDLYRAYS